MVPSYNGWEDAPEDEREELEQWEAWGLRRRSSRAIPRPDLSWLDGIAGES
ncbi:MAG TPA: hypothetical protein VIM84_01425 [Gemmatimonadales bacterium]